MKKIFLLLLIGTQLINAQGTSSKSVLSQKKNEFRVDVLSLATSGNINLTYERFLNSGFSIGVSGGIANNKKVNDEFDEGNRNTIPKYEITPFVRYNLSQGARSFYFAEIFACANGGDFRETIVLTDASNNDYYEIKKSNYSDVALGAGIGYKYYIKDAFGIEFLVGFGSNLFNKEKSPDILSRVGLGISYRF